MQEDLEAEFQSLFSLLEELKEGMLMKIKQDRASRTYELQVCVDSPRPPPSRHPPLRPSDSTEPSWSHVFLQTSFSCSHSWRCPQMSPVSRARHPGVVGLTSSFPGLLLVPSLAMTHQTPHPPALPLNPLFHPPPLLHHHSHTPTSGRSSFLSSPSASSFSALPTGPPNLMAKHPPWLLWDLRLQAGITGAALKPPGQLPDIP